MHAGCIEGGVIRLTIEYCVIVLSTESLVLLPASPNGKASVSTLLRRIHGEYILVLRAGFLVLALGFAVHVA